MYSHLLNSYVCVFGFIAIHTAVKLHITCEYTYSVKSKGIWHMSFPAILMSNAFTGLKRVKFDDCKPS